MARLAPTMLVTFHNIHDTKQELTYDECSNDLAFLVDSSTLIRLRDIDTSENIADQLAQAVAANASNLFTHTRRIFFHFQRGDAEGLYSALVDLFLVLGERGLPLRRRLLRGAQTCLEATRYQALSACIGQRGAAIENELPAATRSVVTLGLDGHCNLLIQNQPADQELRDALLEAREYIEFSQIDQARELLEKCVLEQPDREELQQELVSVYEASRDHDRYLVMRGKLEQILDTLPQCWLTSGLS